MESLKSIYQKYYYLSPLEQSDTAEKNRIRSLYLSLIFFILGFSTLVIRFIQNRNNLYEKTADLMFLGISSFSVFIAFILSFLFKNCRREKAYFVKNIPVYQAFIWGVGSGIYNSYIQKDPFMGVMNFMIAVIVMFCIFSISPIITSFIILLAALGLAPGLINEFGLDSYIYFSFFILFVILLSFFLRYREKLYLSAIKKQKKNLEIKTFGNFTPLYDKKVIKFSRTKSNELLAYLIYKDGSSVNTKELLTVLYGEHADSARYGASLRLLISDIRHTLAELEIQNFFITEYNNFRINPEVVQCDYYDFLAGDRQALKSFTGEFMSQYSWAEPATAFLERKIGLVD